MRGKKTKFNIQEKQRECDRGMIKIKSKWKFKAPMITNQVLLVCWPIYAFYMSQFCFCLLFPQIMFTAAEEEQRRPQVRLGHPGDPALLTDIQQLFPRRLLAVQFPERFWNKV